jgi:two-component system, LytTR family, response regulator LytT
MTISIIEDEPAIARNLEFMLREADPDIHVLARLGSVTEAVEWLRAHDCDLVFMDIRLSDGLSFDIFERLSLDVPVIFVTAYHEYALQAFKSNGIDYILKPFDQADIAQALAKFKRLRKNALTADHFAQIRLMAETLKAESVAYKQSFLVHFREKMIPVAALDIAWFYTANELVHATSFDRKKYLIDFTLEQLAEQLDPRSFFRANRQFIIQRKAIREVEWYFNGRLLLKTQEEPEEKIIISKARAPEFKTWMNA